jgi:hypothetical protein
VFLIFHISQILYDEDTFMMTLHFFCFTCVNKSWLFIFPGSKYKFLILLHPGLWRDSGVTPTSSREICTTTRAYLLIFDLSYMTCTHLKKKEQNWRKWKQRLLFVNAKYYICSLYISFWVPLDLSLKSLVTRA